MAPIPPMPLGRHDSRIVGFAYVPNYLGKNVSGYAIKADGSLAQLAGHRLKRAELRGAWRLIQKASSSTLPI